MFGRCVGPREGAGVGFCVILGDPTVGAPVVGNGVRAGGVGVFVTGDGVSFAGIGNAVNGGKSLGLKVTMDADGGREGMCDSDKGKLVTVADKGEIPVPGERVDGPFTLVAAEELPGGTVGMVVVVSGVRADGVAVGESV